VIALLGRNIRHGEPSSIPDQSVRSYDEITGIGNVLIRVSQVFQLSFIFYEKHMILGSGSFVQTHTQSLTKSHTHSLAHTHSHTLTRTHSLAHTHTHTNTPSQTLTHSHTHTNTHTHTH